MRIVLTHGCWDILTMGHLEHFERAREMGDYLVVSVSTDDVVSRKGADRPVRPIEHRVRMLCALRVVDEVWVCRSGDATEAIYRFCPAWFVQGIDYAVRGPTASEREACSEVGTRWTHTLHPKEESTSDLIKRIRACGF